MKNLHDFFEQMPTKDFTDLLALGNKKSINPVSQRKIFDYVGLVYCAEKNIDEADVDEDELIKLIEDLFLSAALYANVVNGRMRIVSGRIKLTDGDSCKFSLTKQGIRHVESMIK